MDGRFDVRVVSVATAKNMSTAEWPVFGAGEILDIDITFDRDIEVNGVPTLNIQGGGVASYTRGGSVQIVDVGVRAVPAIQSGAWELTYGPLTAGA